MSRRPKLDVSLEATRHHGWMAGMAITPEQARSASLVLAGHVADAAELRLWLEICGLLEYEPGATRTPCGRRSTAKKETA